MPENNWLDTILCNVDTKQIVNVDKNRLEAHDELAVPQFRILQYVHAACSNIKLVLPFDQEDTLIGIVCIYFDNEESEFPLVFVAHYIEILLIRFISDRPNLTDFKFLLEICVLFFFWLSQVNVNTIFGRSNHYNRLILIGLKL